MAATYAKRKEVNVLKYQHERDFPEYSLKEILALNYCFNLLVFFWKIYC